MSRFVSAPRGLSGSPASSVRVRKHSLLFASRRSFELSDGGENIILCVDTPSGRISSKRPHVELTSMSSIVEIFVATIMKSVQEDAALIPQQTFGS